MGSLPQRPDPQHTARPVKDRSTSSGAERPVRGCGDTLSPRGPPAYARAASDTRVRLLSPGTSRACDRGPPAPQLVWHALRPALAPRPWERSWLVHTARPGLDAGVLRQYIPNACVVWAFGPRDHTTLLPQRRTGRTACLRSCSHGLGKRACTGGRTAVARGASASCLPRQQWTMRGAGLHALAPRGDSVAFCSRFL